MKEIKARLSDDARGGWVGFCDEHGVTLSGLLEAVGRLMAADQLRETQQVDRVVALARQIDRERAKRS